MGDEAGGRTGRDDRESDATLACAWSAMTAVADRPLEAGEEDCFETLPDAVIIIDQSGRIVRANQQCLKTFGYTDRELVGKQVELLIPARMRTGHVAHRRSFQERPTIRQMGAGLELRGCRKDGGEFPVDIMLSPLGGSEGTTLAVIRDVSEMSKIKEKLSELAYTDELTGLANRAALYRDLRVLVAAAESPDSSFAVALFDLDKFKVVNDTLGHSSGDDLLRMASKRWRGSVRDDVRLYRLGGDEFMAVIPDCGDPRAVAVIVTRLLDALAEPFSITGRQIHISSSAGIALAPADGKTADVLFANADLALYRAKAEGINRFAFFKKNFRAEIESRERLNVQLRTALLEGHFELFFQPIVCLDARRIVGAEALLRLWDDGRAIAPAAFMSVLETNPLVNEVGDWILAEACRAAARLKRKGPADFRVAMNLFPSQFDNPDLPSQVARELGANGLSPASLHLEITESVALNNSEAVLRSMRALRGMGVGLAFDDFGTGYASLSFLTVMPLTHIKIDSSFTRELPDSPTYAPIVRSLVQMTKDLGMGLIAEGVENHAQEGFLRDLGCPEAQGYLYGRPVPLPELERMLDQGGNFLSGANERARQGSAGPWKRELARR